MIISIKISEHLLFFLSLFYSDEIHAGAGIEGNSHQL